MIKRFLIFKTNFNAIMLCFRMNCCVNITGYYWFMNSITMKWSEINYDFLFNFIPVVISSTICSSLNASQFICRSNLLKSNFLPEK